MDNIAIKSENLKKCHVNCQMLHAHLDEFRHFFEDSIYHIICMSETWLKNEIPDNMVTFRGYSLFRCDRIERQGEGVGFYLANFLSSVIIEQSNRDVTHKKPEYIIAEMLVARASF